MPQTTGLELRRLTKQILERWDDRVRAEVPAATQQEHAVLRDSLQDMLGVLVRVLIDETDPRTAARDLDYITTHGGDRALQPAYSLEAMILECQILEEVVLEALEPTDTLDLRDRTMVVRYIGEIVRISAAEYARVQTEQIAKINRAKDEFLAMLGHELRNPLSAISSALALIREGTKSRQAPERALQVAERQVGHMTKLVNDLLDVARIDQGTVVLHEEILDLGVLVDQTVEAFRTEVERRQLTLAVTHAAEPILVQVDPTRLAQSLSNLLANAAKYTHSGGSIEVLVARRGEEAVITVRDNGIGIAPHLLPNVFDLFTQATRTMDRSEGGLGIGLTVVRRLIELHGGQVEAKSDGLGKGSEFSIFLPEAREAPPAPPAALPVESAGRVRVLIVDDNADAAEMLSALLEALGHDVAVAHDGQSALLAAERHRPDLALVDLGLPGITGYELALQLRSGVCRPPVQLVALTGYAANPEALSAAGFDRHVTKPIQLPQLQELLTVVRAAGPVWSSS